ncbi:MAG: hypothetical protein DYG88_00165 [Chloroflexi bacterium CFX4]|nr:hypothetical protein [Chloroflexi bacterium CFX4]MDL1921687.1 hypothetical protein [Chloroflexi bacterium CFX3]
MSIGIQSALGKVLSFLDQLDTHHIWYRLEHVRDSIMVTISVPGERWEVEFFEDGQIEVERFHSSGVVVGESALDELIAQHGSDAG